MAEWVRAGRKDSAAVSLYTCIVNYWIRDLGV